MTDKELQELIRLKKYEQPEEGYFEDFLLEFQQRQRSEMLQTSARGLLLERLKAWFNEYGASKYMPWIAGGGVAYATVALFLSFSPGGQSGTSEIASVSEEIIETEEVSKQPYTNSMTVSMENVDPVDFSSPKPVFATEERYF